MLNLSKFKKIRKKTRCQKYLIVFNNEVVQVSRMPSFVHVIDRRIFINLRYV